jgi:hypothetical protein
MDSSKVTRGGSSGVTVAVSTRVGTSPASKVTVSALRTSVSTASIALIRGLSLVLPKNKSKRAWKSANAGRLGAPATITTPATNSELSNAGRVGSSVSDKRRPNSADHPRIPPWDTAKVVAETPAKS